MSRRIGPLLFVLTLLLSLFFTNTRILAQKKASKPELENDTFTFLVVSNARPGATDNSNALREVLRQANAQSPRPSFLVATGDVTDSGRGEEYAKFRETAQSGENTGLTVYAVPGSRDVLRAPEGKEAFTNAFGKLYQSFDFGGAHFVLLDSTVTFSSWGHLERTEMDWLGRDLKKVKPDVPVFVFLYHAVHPASQDTPATRLLDNDYDLLSSLRGHNVISIFTGSERRDVAWLTNGIQTLASQGVGQGSCYRVTVTKLLITVDRITQAQPNKPDQIVSLPVRQRVFPSLLRADWDDPDVPYLVRRRPAATLAPRAVTDAPDTEQAQYRLDDGPFRPMTKDARDIWRAQYKTGGIAIGIHTADILLTTSNNVALQQELIWELERDNREPTRRWAVTLDGSIQSSPVRDATSLYVSSGDGRVTAFELNKGKQRWQFKTKGGFLASPILADGTLYVGGTDHFVYALDAANGKVKWKWDASFPIFAAAAVANGTVCVGLNGKIVGLDVDKGGVKWTQNASDASFQTPIVTEGSTFVLSGTNGTCYALDAGSGTVKWTANAGTKVASVQLTQAAPHPAPLSAAAAANGRAYTISSDGLLHAYEMASGRELWTIRAPQNGDSLTGATLTAGGDSLIATANGPHGDAYSLNPANGSVRWRVSTGQPFYQSGARLSPDGTRMAVMGFRGRVSVLETGTGKRLWSYELGPGNIFSTPEYDGSVVYTVTMANDVQALNPPGVSGTGVNPK